MIVRTWRCQPTTEQADAYARYLTGTVFASLEGIAGHRGGYLLRREVEGQIEFLAVTFWDSVEAIKEYAGETIDTAVVKPEARAMLSEFDTFVRHYAIVHNTVGEKG
jgi:heme-degrading monooxygenase HmoA